MNFKRFSALLLTAVIICLALACFASAEEKSPRLVDDAKLLTDADYQTVLAKLDEISEKLKFDIVVVTVNDYGNSSIVAYADDFYDYHGYGLDERHSGALLLLSMNTREWYISTTGEGIEIIDTGLISDEFVGYLTSGRYKTAFIAYANACADAVEDSRSFHFVRKLLIALVVGFIVAFIVAGSMKRQLTSVQMVNQANDYVRPGSLNITDSKDLFLYASVTRTARPRDEGRSGGGGGGTHTSSSGTSHGGGGGKF